MKSFVDELPQFPSKAPLLGEISSECGSGSSFDGSNDETNQPSIMCSPYSGNKLSPTMKFLPPSYLSATAANILQANNININSGDTSAYHQQVNESVINIDDSSSMGDPAILKRASGVIDIQAMDDDSPVTYETSLHSKIDYIEDDKPIVAGIKVRAATIPKLIQILVDSFGKLSGHLATTSQSVPFNLGSGCFR